MRLRNSASVLKRLQHRLRTSQHFPGDPYWEAMHRSFWDKVRYDKRLAKGEI